MAADEAMVAPSQMRRTDVAWEVNRVTGDIVDAAIKVHRTLGPGLLESAYRACLRRELILRGHHVEVEVPVGLIYEGEEVEVAFRLDLRVARTVIVELKAVRELDVVHVAQVMTYLKVTGHPVALLINFNALPLKDGIRRLVLPKS